MKISLSNTALGLSVMVTLLVVKLAFWVGLVYVVQHFVVKYW